MIFFFNWDTTVSWSKCSVQLNLLLEKKNKANKRFIHLQRTYTVTIYSSVTMGKNQIWSNTQKQLIKNVILLGFTSLFFLTSCDTEEKNVATSLSGIYCFVLFFDCLFVFF